jgi:carbonic anhydrase
LTQFHFDTVSEHRLNGEEFPMELHLVHEADDGRLLVLGVFIEAGPLNPELQRIFRDLPADETQSRMIDRFDLDALIPHDRDTYRYEGSLTTSPFTEEFKGSSTTSRCGCPRVRSTRSSGSSRTETAGSARHSTIARS